MSPSVRFSWSPPLMYIIITNVTLRFRSSTSVCHSVADIWGFPDGSLGKESACKAGETQVHSRGQEDLLEEEMATCSSILAWKIPWTEEPGGLQSKCSQRVGRDLACTNTQCH